MAQIPGIDLFVTSDHRTRTSLPHGTRRSCLSGPKDAAIVHLAETTGVGEAFATLDGAFPHGPKRRGPVGQK